MLRPAFLCLAQCVVLLSALFPAAPVYAEPPEAVNYFLPAQYRNTPTDQIPATVTEASLARLNLALKTINDRLVVPIVPKGEKNVRMVRYFEYLESDLRQITSPNSPHPVVSIDPSAGVVRSEIGLINYLCHLGEENGIPAEKTMDSIISGEHAYFDPITGDLPGYYVRGVGSDFDALLATNRPDMYETYQERATEISNSAEEAYGMRQANVNSGIKRTLFLVGDIKPLHDMPNSKGEVPKNRQSQLNRSATQGGSNVDLMYFDRRAGKLKSPASHPNIDRQMVLGIYTYSPAGTVVEQKFKQTTRGIRPLLETAHLKLDKESEKVLKADLNELLRAIESGEFAALPETEKEKVVEQFDRVVRNARFGGAWNRIHRASDPQSVDGTIRQIVEKLTASLQRRQLLIPEFVGSSRIPAEGRSTSDMPPHLVLSQAEILRAIPGGVLNHGTPEIDSGLALLRGGMFVTRYETGMRRGGFVSPLRDYSLTYAKNSGMVLELRLRKDRPLRVFNYREHANDPWVKALEKEAEEKGVHASDLLDSKYGIDLIILNPKEWVVKNMAVFEPTTLVDVVHAYGSLAENPRASVASRLEAISNFNRMLVYGEGLGLKDLGQPKTLDEKALKQIAADARQNVFKVHGGGVDPDLYARAMVLAQYTATRDSVVVSKPDKQRRARIGSYRPEVVQARAWLSVPEEVHFAALDVLHAQLHPISLEAFQRAQKLIGFSLQDLADLPGKGGLDALSALYNLNPKLASAAEWNTLFSQKRAAIDEMFKGPVATADRLEFIYAALDKFPLEYQKPQDMAQLFERLHDPDPKLRDRARDIILGQRSGIWGGGTRKYLPRNAEEHRSLIKSRVAAIDEDADYLFSGILEEVTAQSIQDPTLAKEILSELERQSSASKLLPFLQSYLQKAPHSQLDNSADALRLFQLWKRLGGQVMVDTLAGLPQAEKWLAQIPVLERAIAIRELRLGRSELGVTQDQLDAIDALLKYDGQNPKEYFAAAKLLQIDFSNFYLIPAQQRAVLLQRLYRDAPQTFSEAQWKELVQAADREADLALKTNKVDRPSMHSAFEIKSKLPLKHYDAMKDIQALLRSPDAGERELGAFLWLDRTRSLENERLPPPSPEELKILIERLPSVVTPEEGKWGRGDGTYELLVALAARHASVGEKLIETARTSRDPHVIAVTREIVTGHGDPVKYGRGSRISMRCNEAFAKLWVLFKGVLPRGKTLED